MRVAYVCIDPGVPVFGHKGCSVHVQEVIRAFRQRGDEVTVFATRLGQKAPSDLKNVACHQLALSSGKRGPQRERALTNLNGELRKGLELAGPFDLIYERYSLFGFAAMRFARQTGSPGILEVNAPLILEQQSHRTLYNKHLAIKLTAVCLKDADSVIAVSPAVAGYVSQFSGMRKRAVVVSNGVNVSRFTVKQFAGQTDQPVVIGFIGTLKPWHGVQHLLSAVSRLRAQFSNVILQVVGDGPMRGQLERQLARYSLEIQRSTRWLGAVPNERVPQVLSQFDIAVAPYPHLTNFYFSPIKIFEYMAAGLPVVASRIGQISQIVEDAVHGVLYPPNDIAALTESLLYLCQNPSARQQMGSAGRRKVEQHHTWESVLSRSLETLSCVSSPTGGNER